MLYYFVFSYFNILAFISLCLNVFTVYMLLYVISAIGMLFNKWPLTYLLTYLIYRNDGDVDDSNNNINSYNKPALTRV